MSRVLRNRPLICHGEQSLIWYVRGTMQTAMDQSLRVRSRSVRLRALNLGGICSKQALIWYVWIA
jgi:hypothetical protein